MKPPHARPDPRYYPPDRPSGNLSFVLLVAALAIIIVVLVIAFSLI